MNEECLICKTPLEYLNADEEMECVLCHKYYFLAATILLCKITAPIGILMKGCCRCRNSENLTLQLRTHFWASGICELRMEKSAR